MRSLIFWNALLCYIADILKVDSWVSPIRCGFFTFPCSSCQLKEFSISCSGTGVLIIVFFMTFFLWGVTNLSPWRTSNGFSSSSSSSASSNTYTSLYSSSADDYLWSFPSPPEWLPLNVLLLLLLRLFYFDPVLLGGSIGWKESFFLPL